MTETLDAPTLLVHGDDEVPRRWRVGDGEVVLTSRRSPGKSGPNEDAGLLVPLASGLVLAVADGCGGMPAADEAARRALEAFAAEIGSAVVGAGLVEAVLAGFDRANEAVLDMRAGAGTTLTAALVAEGVVRAFHAGDSTLLVTGQRGRLRLALVAHSPTGYAVEAGLLSERDAMRHEERSVVLNIVGSAAMRVDVSPALRLGARDTVVVASDGLTDNLLTGEIVEGIRRGPLPRSVAMLSEAATARMVDETTGDVHPGHPDDLTIAAYRPTVVGG